MTVSGTMISRHEGPIGYLIFNNPKRHNAVSLEMWQAVSAILSDFARDPAVRVVVLTGAGEKAFVAGADISRFDQERSDQDAIAHYNAVTEQTFADLEACAAAVRRCFTSSDYNEGRKAFMEKRPPQFTGT